MALAMSLAPRLARRVDLASALLLLLVWAAQSVTQPHRHQQPALEAAECDTCLPRARASSQPLSRRPTVRQSEHRPCAGCKRPRTSGGTAWKSTCHGRLLERRIISELTIGWASSLTRSRMTIHSTRSSPLKALMILTMPWSSLGRSWRDWWGLASMARALSALRSTRNSLQLVQEHRRRRRQRRRLPSGEGDPRAPRRRARMVPLAQRLALRPRPTVSTRSAPSATRWTARERRQSRRVPTQAPSGLGIHRVHRGARRPSPSTRARVGRHQVSAASTALVRRGQRQAGRHRDARCHLSASGL